MHVIDFVALAIVLFCIIRGYQKGFLYKAIQIVSLVASLYLAWYLSEPLSKLFNFSSIFQFDFGHEVLNGAVTMLFTHIFCFIVIFIILQVLFLVLKLASKVFTKIPVVSGVNAVAGAVLGAVQGFLILCLLCIGLSLNSDFKGVIENSTLRYVQVVNDHVLSFMNEDIERFAISMDSLTKGEVLNEEEITTIYEWLLDLEIEEGTAEEIINTLR